MKRERVSKQSVTVIVAIGLAAFAFIGTPATAQEIEECDGQGAGDEEWNGEETTAYNVSWDCDGSGDSWSPLGLWGADKYGYCQADGYTHGTEFLGFGSFDANYGSSATGSCDEDGGSGGISGSYSSENLQELLDEEWCWYPPDEEPICVGGNDD